MNYEISHLEMYSHAFDFYGEEEIRGDRHNQVIVDFFQELGYDWIDDDETPWCSAFINYLAKECGYEYTGKLNARSWLDIGNKCVLPTVGDIAVFWREDPNSWKGHVGMFVRDDGTHIWVLGGNQSNKVTISRYPKHTLLDYRMLNKES